MVKKDNGMSIGEKIRHLRNLKGLSQENLAKELGITQVAYGDIERNRVDFTYGRLEKIAELLGTDVIGLLSYGERIANFFDNCNGSGYNVNNTNYGNDAKELKHQLEKAELQIKLLQAEKEKAEMETLYWKEKVPK